jgi:hypothetical protein
MNFYYSLVLDILLNFIIMELLFYILQVCRMYDVWLSSISWAVNALMYSDMFYIQWLRLARRIYGINKYMNEWMPHQITWPLFKENFLLPLVGQGRIWFKILEVHNIPCESSQIYIKQTIIQKPNSWSSSGILVSIIWVGQWWQGTLAAWNITTSSRTSLSHLPNPDSQLAS